MRTRLGGVAALAAFCTLAGCGGGSDSTPDARPEAPDAEQEAPPDAQPSALGPVTNLTASAGETAGTVELSWTNPTGAAGVIVVRRLAEPEVAAPVAGTSYDAGDTLGVGDVVVYAGTGTTFTDTGVPPGYAHYAAFARDDASVWATPAARARAFLVASAQTATIVVDLTPVGATVMTQPANYQLAANATYDGTTQTLTVHVDATSGFARNVFVPKAEVTAVSQGTITGDGTLDTFPYVRLAQAIAPAGTGGGDLVFTGVDGTVDPVLIDLAIVDHPAGFAFLSYQHEYAYELIDTGTLSSAGTVPCDPLKYVDGTGNQSAFCTYRAGGLTDDARRMYVGHRSLPVVREIDPVTGAVIRTATLDAGIGAVRNVALSPDGTTLYALLTLRGHAYWGGINGDLAGPDEDQVLVKLDAASMTEMSRLVIVPAADVNSVRLSDVAVSPDGARVAVVERAGTSGNVHLIDAAAMTEVDTDAVTAGLQPFDVSSILTSLKHATFASDGSHLYVQAQSSSALAQITVATGAVATVTLGDSTANSGGLVAGADGTVFATHGSGPNALSRIDGVTVTPALETAGAPRGRAIGLANGRVYVIADGVLYVFDAETMAEVPGDGATLEGGAAHDLLFTPF